MPGFPDFKRQSRIIVKCPVAISSGTSIVSYLEGIYFFAYYLGLIKLFHCVKHNKSYNAMEFVNKIAHCMFEDSMLLLLLHLGFTMLFNISGH